MNAKQKSFLESRGYRIKTDWKVGDIYYKYQRANRTLEYNGDRIQVHIIDSGDGPKVSYQITFADKIPMKDLGLFKKETEQDVSILLTLR